MKMFETYDPDVEGQIVLHEVDSPYGEKYIWVLNENTREISFTTTSKTAIKDFKDFLMRYPFMTGIAFGVGMNALDAYKQNKKLTTRFFARTPIERRLYQDVVNDLVKTGKYTLTKNAKRTKGGVLWELKRKGVV